MYTAKTCIDPFLYFEGATADLGTGFRQSPFRARTGSEAMTSKMNFEMEPSSSKSCQQSTRYYRLIVIELFIYVECNLRGILIDSRPVYSYTFRFP